METSVSGQTEEVAVSHFLSYIRQSLLFVSTSLPNETKSNEILI